MKNKLSRAYKKRKQKLENRLDPTPYVSARPILGNERLRYEISDRIDATSFGGIGFASIALKNLGLAPMIDAKLELLKVHQPYHESDHVLTLIYNLLCGGDCLEDIELLRNDSAFLDALGARRIPDPTTSGDFLRRFGYDDILTLLDIMNDINVKVWKLSGAKSRIGLLDIDSTIQETSGECKERMDISYNGKWGFHPLVITEAESGLHVCLVNRSGNCASQMDAAKWIDYAVENIRDSFAGIRLRGDSAFSLTSNFDRWADAGIEFCFSFDATSNLVEIADKLPKNAWHRIERAVEKQHKKIKRRAKEERIESRGYRHMQLEKRFAAEFHYRPTKCGKEYRVVVERKNIHVTKGQLLLSPEVRYFFYITNIESMSPVEVLEFTHGRCNHENRIEQLDNGVHALHMPAAEFKANWAFMVIGAMAWNTKSWMGLSSPDIGRGESLVRMEFKRFVRSIILLPCQVLRQARYTVLRLLNVNHWTPWLCENFVQIAATG